MSEHGDGPGPGVGWWQASDNQWYPPEQHPDYTAPAAVAPPPGFAPPSGLAAPPSFAPPTTFAPAASAAVPPLPPDQAAAVLARLSPGASQQVAAMAKAGTYEERQAAMAVLADTGELTPAEVAGVAAMLPPPGSPPPAVAPPVVYGQPAMPDPVFLGGTMVVDAGGPQTCKKANTALALGIISLIAPWMIVWINIFLALGAIVEGVGALVAIDRSQGRLTGRNRAIVGLVLGGFGIIMTLMAVGYYAGRTA